MLEPNEEQNIVLDASQDICWIIRGSLRPSMFFKEVKDGVPEAKLLMDLREQVNSAILRFTDEPGLNTIPLYLSEMQAWALDSLIPYDGDGGKCSSALLQLFRGLWSQSMGLPTNLSQNPKDTWQTPTPEADETDPTVSGFEQWWKDAFPHAQLIDPLMLDELKGKIDTEKAADDDEKE